MRRNAKTAFRCCRACAACSCRSQIFQCSRIRIEVAHRALARLASTTDRHWQRAQRLIAENRIAEAKATLESIVSHAPHRSDVRMILASVMLSEGTIRNAAEQAVIASKNLPNHAQPVSTVVQALLRIGETTAARDALLRFN